MSSSFSSSSADTKTRHGRWCLAALVFALVGFALANAAVGDQATLELASRHDRVIMSLAYSPDGTQLASGAADRTVAIWNTETGGLQMSRGVAGGVVELVFAGDARHLVSGTTRGGSIDLYNAESGLHHRTLQRLEEEACSQLVAANDSSAAAAVLWTAISLDHPSRIVVWHLNDPAEWQVPGRFVPAPAISISPDGRWLAVADRRSPVAVWDLRAHRRATGLGRSRIVASEVSFSPDGELLATASLGGEIELRHVPTWEMVDRFTVSTDRIRHVVFTPDSGKLILDHMERTEPDADAQRVLRVYSLGERRLWLSRAVIAAPYSMFRQGLDVSRDGSLVAVGSGVRSGNLVVWRLREDESIHKLWSAPVGGAFVAFSPSDPNELASAGQQLGRPEGVHVVRLWDATTGEQTGSLGSLFESNAPVPEQ